MVSFTAYNFAAIIFLLAGTTMAAETNDECTTFPTSVEAFSSKFQQPSPPLIKPSFKTSFIQHKWDVNLSHITQGYIYNSPEHTKVRVDEAYDSGLAASLFNYGNTTKEGLVENILVSYTNILGKPEIFRDYVNPNFPLWTEDTLVKSEAVFGGLVDRQFVSGKVGSWNIIYQGVLPVTVFVDSCGVIVGYDYFAPGRRTRVITTYFNTQVGPVDGKVFDGFN